MVNFRCLFFMVLSKCWNLRGFKEQEEDDVFLRSCVPLKTIGSDFREFGSDRALTLQSSDRLSL